MIIVRATQPPSMAVEVNTIVAGIVTLPVTLAHVMGYRSDIVIVRDGLVGIVIGPESKNADNALIPAPHVGTKSLAVISIRPGQNAIYQHNIKELDIW